MKSSMHASTPMALSTKLDLDLIGKSVSKKVYRDVIGLLLHLIASGPNIMFIMCLCKRFQSTPKESHRIAVKRIFRYLAGTKDIEL